DVGWVDEVKRLATEGFDAVFDSVGTTLLDSLSVTKPGGTVVFFGMAGGDPPAVDPRLLMDRSLHLVGGDLWNVLTTASERQLRADFIFSEIMSGALQPKIGACFPLSAGSDAHARLESRKVCG